jgi:hypothetical protein
MAFRTPNSFLLANDRDEPFPEEAALQDSDLLAAFAGGDHDAFASYTAAMPDQSFNSPFTSPETQTQPTSSRIPCKGTRVTVTIPAHAVGNDRDIKVVNERWYSDDLMVLVKSTNDDPRFGTSSYELKNVNRSEPDPSLFKLPEGFSRSSRR